MTEKPLLTDRERGILYEMAEGDTTEEIMRQFYISEGTVKQDLRSISKKLGARNRTNAVALAIRRGLI